MENAHQQKNNRFKVLIRFAFHSTCVFFTLSLIACSSAYKVPDLGGLYNSMVQNESPYRNPVILIPGLLGSKLVDEDTGAVVWGSFGTNIGNPRTAEGARIIALPMRNRGSLDEMRDQVVPAGTLDRVKLNLFGYPLEQNTYAHILSILCVA